MRNYRNGFFLFLVSAIPVIWAVLPLFRPGYIPTHDGEYHILRIHEFTTMLRNGYVLPRWAPGFNSGYGVPVFVFHYPLPNYIGSLYHMLGLSLVDSFKLTLATGYILAWVCAFIWLNKCMGLRAASVGSIVFAFVPYWFVELYVRGSVGEVLALAWVLGILVGIEYGKTELVALFMGLLIPTHNILALMFSPFLFLYAWVRNRKEIRGIVIGILLASFFWIPALAERQYVVGLNTVDFHDHFPQVYQLLIPSWGTGFSGGVSANQISFQIGVIPILLFCMFLLRRKRNNHLDYQDRVFFITGVLTIFLLSGVSRQMWELIPFLQFIQYPWRFLSFIIFISAFVAARISQSYPLIVSVSVAVLAFVLVAQYTRPVVYEVRDDAYYLSRKNFTDGTSSMGNAFSTKWSAWKSERPARRISSEPEAIIQHEDVTPGSVQGDITVPNAARVKINVAYYPGWSVVLDGRQIPVGPDEEGTITISVPEGSHSIEAVFGETKLRTAANAISGFCLFSLIVWAILKRSAFKPHLHL